MKIVCMSDTHSRTLPHIPKCDVLVHAGDMTNMGTERECLDALKELSAYRQSGLCKRIVMTPGNHDFFFEKELDTAMAYCDDLGIDLLVHSHKVIEGKHFFGSPWTPWFHDWAFNGPQDQIEGRDWARKMWSAVPIDTEILVTHGPARGTLDATPRNQWVGCPELALCANHLPELRLHVFGHIHGQYGVTLGHGYDNRADCDAPSLCVNASLCDEGYNLVNAPILVHLL